MGNRKSKAGFTLIEMLVVVGVVALLGTLIGVAVTRARRGADKFKLAAQLQTIGVALEAYKSDFGNYPTTSLDDALRLTAGTTTADNTINAAGLRGARLLCKALIAPGPQGTAVAPSTFNTDRPDQDGKDGPGFRVPPRSGVFNVDASATLVGKVYGPYLSSSSLRYSKTDATGALVADKAYDDTTVIIDGNDKPVLFYPCLNPQAALNQPGPGSLAGMFVAGGDPTGPGDAANNALPMYRGTDNEAWLPIQTMRQKLGDTTGNAPGTAPDGMINAGTVTTEKAATRGKYILWTAGPDGIFGVNSNVAPGSNDRVDDVTNFDNE